MDIITQEQLDQMVLDYNNELVDGDVFGDIEYRNLTFKDIDLSLTDFSYSKIVNCVFINCSLPVLDCEDGIWGFTKATLENAKFINCNAFYSDSIKGYFKHFVLETIDNEDYLINIYVTYDKNFAWVGMTYKKENFRLLCKIDEVGMHFNPETEPHKLFKTIQQFINDNPVE